MRRGVRGLRRDMEFADDPDSGGVARKKRRFAAIVTFGVVMLALVFLASISIS